LFKAKAQIDIVHVPYKGSAPALQDVIAGSDQMMFATTSGVMGFLGNNQVRALAVTTLKRTAVLPDVPTMDEAGLAGFEATTWHGLVAPAGTPQNIVETLHRAIVEALKDAGVQQKLAALGIDTVGDTPHEFTAYIGAEIPKWAAIIKASGAKME
jgi:tripartite-type tricarboxylate transporter receptor subunit TctC